MASLPSGPRAYAARYMLGKTGDRKLRLFACACVRRIWPLLQDERSRTAVEMAERYADYPGGLTQLSRVRVEASLAAQLVYRRTRQDDLAEDEMRGWFAANAAEATVEDTGWDVARHTARRSALTFCRQAEAERRVQCELVRDLFGNPFRPETFNPAWLRWHDHCVVKMAQSIYEERRFEELPILADALEEAGCENEEILWHCREPGEHVTAAGWWMQSWANPDTVTRLLRRTRLCCKTCENGNLAKPGCYLSSPSCHLEQFCNKADLDILRHYISDESVDLLYPAELVDYRADRVEGNACRTLPDVSRSGDGSDVVMTVLG